MDRIALFLIGAVSVGFVLAPVFRARRTAASGLPSDLDDDWLDREVERYREAVRAGTVCGSCRFANPAGSRYCADCGRRLPER